MFVAFPDCIPMTEGWVQVRAWVRHRTLPVERSLSGLGLGFIKGLLYRYRV